VAGSVAERLYYDAAALEFTARVADIRLESREGGEALWQVALDRTAFYPEGGGQPWDTGVLIATAKSGAVLEVAVERVEEDEAGEVWHAVRKPLVEGTEIVGRVDAERRMDHAQQHSGQHLLSAVFLRELGAKTVGFRLSALKTGAEVVTIDVAVDKLSEEEIARVEAAANRVVYQDRALRPGWVSREDAEAMLARGDLRKLPERAGPMRIVEMEGVEFNACGGTHVAATGAIGGILVRRVEKVKQGQRVEFCCGLRAVRAARADYERLSGVAKMLSVGAGDVAGRVEKLIEDKRAAAKEIKTLQKQLAQAVLQPALGDVAAGRTMSNADVMAEMDEIIEKG
jgi:alanyl-tRNA synthetase